MLKRAAGHLMVWIGVLLASWLCMIVGVDVAHGQVYEKPSGEPEVALGEFRVTPSLRIAERYDNNIFYSPSGKVDDFLTDTEPRVKITSKGRAVDVAADLGVRWTEYAEHPKLSYYSSQGGLVLKADTLTGRALRGLGLTVTEHYFYTKDYPVFAELNGPNPIASEGIQTNRVTTFGNAAGATASYVLSPRALVLGDYTNVRTQYSGGSTSLFGSTIDLGNAGLEYSLTPTTTLLSDYFYSRFSFQGDGSAETHAADIGAKHQLREDWSVDGRVGGTYIPSLDRLTYNFNVGTTKKFSATEVSARVLRTVFTSGGLAAALSYRTTAQLQVSHRLTPALTATLAGNYGMAKTVGSSTVDLKSYNANAGIQYVLTRWANLFASYSYFLQDSTGTTGFTVNRTQVMVGITMTWQ